MTSQQQRLESRSCCFPCCCWLLLLLRLTVRYPVLLLCCFCEADVAVVPAVESKLAPAFFQPVLSFFFFRVFLSYLMFVSFIYLYLKRLSFVVTFCFQGDNLMSLFYRNIHRELNSFSSLHILFYCCSPQKILSFFVKKLFLIFCPFLLVFVLIFIHSVRTQTCCPLLCIYTVLPTRDPPLV